MDGAFLSNSQMDLLFVLPGAVAYALCMVRLLPFRSRVAYLAIYLSYSVAMGLLRSTGTLAMRMPIGFAFDVLLPIFLSRGPLHRRVLTIALSVSCLFVGELFGGVLWTLLTGGAPLADYDAVRAFFPQYVLMHALHFVVLVALMEALRCLLLHADLDVGTGVFERRSPGLPKVACAPSSTTEEPCRLEVHGQHGGGNGGEERVAGASRVPGTWQFVALPAAQAVLLGIAVYVCIGESRAAGEWYYLACSVLALLCLAVDIVLLWALRTHVGVQRARQHAELLARRLEEGYVESERAIEEVERIARFRHDMRNQLAVVSALAEEGHRDEALRHVRDLRASLQGGGEQ